MALPLLSFLVLLVTASERVVCVAAGVLDFYLATFELAAVHCKLRMRLPGPSKPNERLTATKVVVRVVNAIETRQAQVAKLDNEAVAMQFCADGRLQALDCGNGRAIFGGEA